MSQDLLTIKPTMFSGKFGTPIVAGIATSGNSDGGPYPPGYYGSKVRQSGVPWYVFMSPLSALTDAAMPGTGEIGMGRGVPLISSIMNELMQQFQPREYREYTMKMAYSNWIVIERAGVVVATNPGLFKYKVGASISAVRRGGGMTAVDTMNHFLLNKEVIIAGSTYWNTVYGKAVGDVFNDEEGIKNMHNLGQNMSWLLKKIHC